VHFYLDGWLVCKTGSQSVSQSFSQLIFYGDTVKYDTWADLTIESEDYTFSMFQTEVGAVFGSPA